MAAFWNIKSRLSDISVHGGFHPSICHFTTHDDFPFQRILNPMGQDNRHAKINQNINSRTQNLFPLNNFHLKRNASLT
jgi:hypothetical protein